MGSKKQNPNRERKNKSSQLNWKQSRIEPNWKNSNLGPESWLWNGIGENNATGEDEEEEFGRPAKRVFMSLFKVLGFTVVLTTTHSSQSLYYIYGFFFLFIISP